MPESAKVLTEKIEYNLNYLLKNNPSKGVGKLGELTFHKQEEYRQEVVNYQLRNNISSVYWDRFKKAR